MSPRKPYSEKGAVAGGHPLTVEAAVDVLRAGGSAVDAAVAGLWMACACEPVLASPGGGGFMLLLPPEGGKPQLIDFFVHTPSRKPEEASLDFRAVEADFGTTRQEFHIGAGAAAVPGFVPGLFAAHGLFGRMPMRDLAEPAVRAASRGIAVSPFQARLFSIISPILTHSASARGIFAPGGELLAAGGILQNPDLASAIEAMAHEGVRLATHGEVAAAMVAAADSGGAIRRSDIARYETHWRAPLMRQREGAALFLNPPPSCGGTLIDAMMDRMAAVSHKVDIDMLAQAMERTDRDWRAAKGNLGAFAGLGETASVRSRGTTHISIVDATGFAVSATVSNGEGNGHIVSGCGFMLNNMLGEEDLNPSGFHRWKPDCRLSSMMAPSILRGADGTVTAFGSGGSNRIRTALFQIAARLLNDMKENLEELILLPRIHVENGHLHFEDLFDDRDRASLCKAFPDHTAWAERSMFFGGTHMARRDRDGRLEAAGDDRRDGRGAVT